jgi:hypothetical protein
MLDLSYTRRDTHTHTHTHRKTHTLSLTHIDIDKIHTHTHTPQNRGDKEVYLGLHGCVRALGSLIFSQEVAASTAARLTLAAAALTIAPLFLPCDHRQINESRMG